MRSLGFGVAQLEVQGLLAAAQRLDSTAGRAQRSSSTRPTGLLDLHGPRPRLISVRWGVGPFFARADVGSDRASPRCVRIGQIATPPARVRVGRYRDRLCGRFVSTSPPDRSAKYFGATEVDERLEARTATGPDPGHVPSGEQVRRGGVAALGTDPFWAKEAKIRNKMINAHETIIPGGAFGTRSRSGAASFPSTASTSGPRPRTDQAALVHPPTRRQAWPSPACGRSATGRQRGRAGVLHHHHRRAMKMARSPPDAGDAAPNAGPVVEPR
jgi:hypothetical protein